MYVLDGVFVVGINYNNALNEVDEERVERERGREGQSIYLIILTLFRVCKSGVCWSTAL